MFKLRFVICSDNLSDGPSEKRNQLTPFKSPLKALKGPKKPPSFIAPQVSLHHRATVLAAMRQTVCAFFLCHQFADVDGKTRKHSVAKNKKYNKENKRTNINIATVEKIQQITDVEVLVPDVVLEPPFSASF